MAVRWQTTLCFIVCCCANVIYTEVTDLADRHNASTALPSEESSNRTELETGNLTGIITAHKDGAKLKLKMNSKVIWKKHKSLDSETCAATVVQKGESGDKGGGGLIGLKGNKGEEGDKGADGIQGATGEKGEIGDKGTEGIIGATGEKGEKGDKGADGIQGATGEKGENGDKGDIGPKGIDGKMGDKGNKGIDGKKGEQGDNAIYQESYDERGTDTYPGSQSKPIYSCSDLHDDGPYFVNQENGFEVLCQDDKTCIPNPSKKSDFNVLIKNDKVWLSSYTLDLMNFYGLKISELSYLMTTNEGFELTLEYSSEVEILEILSWNGITMNTTSEPLSNGCKRAQKTEGTQTHLEVKCKPANYLPMDFNIKTNTENVQILLSSLCFS